MDIKSLLRFLDTSLATLVLLIAFRCLLDYSYIVFVAKIFSYSGYTLDISIFKYIESWAYMLMFFIFTPKKLSQVSDYLLFTMLFGLLTPVFSYYALNDQSRTFLYYVMGCCSLVFIFRSGRPVSVPSVRSGTSIAAGLAVSMAAVTTLWFIYSSGFSNFNLNFSKVYDYRDAVSSASYVGPMAYLIPWTTKVVGPAMLGLSLYRRKYFLAFAVFGLHVLWFGFSTHKSVLFYPFLIVGLWAWFRNYRAFSPIFLIASTVISLALLQWSVSGNPMYPSMFVRRVFFGVAKNTFDYFIFFSDNPKVFWSNSVASFFVNYPYEVSPAKVIGQWRGTEASANNSFVSTGYMHAGVFGLVLYGVSVGFLFRFIDSISRSYLQTLVVLSVIFISSRALILNSDLLVALLTHGVGFSILLAILIRKKNYKTEIIDMEAIRDGGAYKW